MTKNTIIAISQQEKLNQSKFGVELHDSMHLVTTSLFSGSQNKAQLESEIILKLFNSKLV